MHTQYRSPILKQLCDQQVRYAPREKKLKQADHAERLLTEIDGKRIYTYEYICYRVTQYRPDSSPRWTVSGEDAKHDLRLFVEDVSDAANVRVEESGQPVRTVDELSRMFNVSTKTISRWREQGLVSRRFLFDGRKRLGFLQSSVDEFVARNPERIQRGERFSQLTDDERSQIVRRARRLASAGGCPSEVTRRIAHRMSRSVETIRYTLKQFDQRNPDLAIFPDRSGPLTSELKQRIYRQYRGGTPVEQLAKQYCRTRTSVYRVIGELRARQIMELPLDFIAHASFDQPLVAAEILAPMPEAAQAAKRAKIPSGLPPYLAALYEVPLLTREQEQHLFRKLNYLKYSASTLRDQLDPNRPKSSLMDRIEHLYNKAVEVKNQIVQANLRLVVSIAKRHVSPSENFFELVSDGNMSLIRAADKFDFSRGNKFSTYATWAIMKNFARTIPDQFKQRDRYRTSYEEMFTATEDASTNEYLQQSAQQLREIQIGKILSRLDDREQRIIISRFGLDYRQEPQTLKELGAQMGVTKERIRQIEARALSKLRHAAREENIELPE
jgi:RNA polymerase primary sigma factor/RNA polymerase sigma factor